MKIGNLFSASKARRSLNGPIGPGVYRTVAMIISLVGTVSSAALAGDGSLPIVKVEAYKPLKRTFETHAGRRYECVIWGLRDAEIGLALDNGSSIWVSIEHVSKTDQEWIALRRPQIEAYLAKTDRVKLTNFNATQAGIKTESLQAALTEEWNGEQSRQDNKFTSLAKLVGVAAVDKSSLQKWYEQLHAGLSFDAASGDIVWKVPTASDFRGDDAAKDAYSQLVLGTLCQKIGVSDVNALRAHVKIDFVTPSTGNGGGGNGGNGNGGGVSPVQDGPIGSCDSVCAPESGGVVHGSSMVCGETITTGVDCCAGSDVYFAPVACSSAEPSGCEPANSRCRIFRFHR